MAERRAWSGELTTQQRGASKTQAGGQGPTAALLTVADPRGRQAHRE